MKPKTAQTLVNIAKKTGAAIQILLMVFCWVGLSSLSAHAQILYWDRNGSALGSGGPSPSGTWDLATASWNTSLNGTNTTVTWVPGSSATFAAGSDATGGYTVDVVGTQSVANLVFTNNGAALLTNGTLLMSPNAKIAVSLANRSASIASVVDGTSITINSAALGSVYLTGDNTFTGPLVIGSGKTYLDSAKAAGKGGILIAPTSPASILSSKSQTRLTNAVELAESLANFDISAPVGVLEMAGHISGNRVTPFTVGSQGTGVVSFGVSNSFIGNVNVVGGTLLVPASGALGSISGRTTVSSGATLALTGGVIYTPQELVHVRGTGVDGKGAFRGLTGHNVFFGNITMDDASTLGVDTNSLTLNGPISGATFDLTKVGMGELILNGPGSSYRNTLVAQGMLVVNASIGSGAITVGGGAKLAVDGYNASIAGPISLAGTIKTIGGVSKLQTGAQTWAAGATYEWSINQADGQPGETWDMLDVKNGSGVVTLNGLPANPIRLVIKSVSASDTTAAYLPDFDNTQEYNFNILTASGGIIGFDPATFHLDTSEFLNDLGNGTFVLRQVGNSLVLSFLQKPSITTPLVNLTNSACGNTELSVGVSSSSSLVYQWMHESTLLQETTSVLSLTNLSAADAGFYTVIVTDTNGSSASSSALLTVVDPLPSISSLPGDILVYTGIGNTDGYKVATWGDPSVSDNCPGALLSGSRSSGDQFFIGTNLVVYTAIDSAGQSNSAGFNVVVIDDTIPTVSGLGNIVTNTSPEDLSGTQVVTWPEPTIFDNSGSTKSIWSHTNGTSFALGDTVVTLVVSDNAGNAITNTFLVTVTDKSPPQVVFANITTNTGVGSVSCSQVVSWEQPVILDNAGVVSTNFSLSPGLSLPVGVTNLLISAEDAAGNKVDHVVTITVVDDTSPVITTNEITLFLDNTGNNIPSAGELLALATDNCALASVALGKPAYSFIDLGTNMTEIVAEDTAGNKTTNSMTVVVVMPYLNADKVYVDCSFGTQPALVGFPMGNPSLQYYVGYNAFNNLQDALDEVAPGGTIYLAPCIYPGNVRVTKPVNILGPNYAFRANDPSRTAEAILIPTVDDPEAVPVISVETNNVRVAGLVIDGYNPEIPLTPFTYTNGTTPVHATAGIQNGIYNEFAMPDFDHLTVENCIFRNLAYDGLYLDRYTLSQFTSASSYNYFVGNLFDNCGEAIRTYAVHSVITENIVTNSTRGIAVHGTITATPNDFTPCITSNLVQIGGMWSTQLPKDFGVGIWVNYRRQQAAPLLVAENTVNTPHLSPEGQPLIGFYVLNVDGNGRVELVNNTVNGYSNCTYGLFTSMVLSNSAVTVNGGRLENIAYIGALASTLDLSWGFGDSKISLSNVNISMSPGGVGAYAYEYPSTNVCRSVIQVLDGTTITGGLYGARIDGTNAYIFSRNAVLSGSTVGIEVVKGRGLLEGNAITNNSYAAIRVLEEGVVDAGDCKGDNITSLGFGQGLNGSSAGGNIFSGYGFDNSTPWAIENLGSIPVRGYANDYGASVGQELDSIVNGPVSISQAGAVSVAPPGASYGCLIDIPDGATNQANFILQGGSVLTIPALISFVDATNNPAPGTGIVTRTYIITDVCGNDEHVQQVFTINDATLPTITAPAMVNVPADFGLCHVALTNVSLGTAQADDNCSYVSVTNDAPINIPLGTNIITWTVVDALGLTSSDTQIVVVYDNQSPVFVNFPGDMTVYTGPASTTNKVAVSWTQPNAEDNCVEAALWSNHQPGDLFNVGSTIVAYSATDKAGNTVTNSFAINVVDDTPPTITGLSDVITNIGLSSVGCEQTVTWPQPTVFDNVDVANVEWSQESGSVFPVGENIVTVVVVDLSNNRTTNSFKVTVEDTTYPTLANMPADITVYTGPGSVTNRVSVTWNEPSADDNCSGAVLWSNYHPGDLFEVGSTIVTYSATDLANNSLTNSFTVTVIDNTPPTISGLSDVITNTGLGAVTCDQVTTWSAPAIFDNVGVTDIIWSRESGSSFGVGDNTVVVVASDAAGNSTTNSFKVTVTDTTYPTLLNIPSDITAYTGSGSLSNLVSVTWTEPYPDDNCSGATLWSDYSPGHLFSVGSTLVTYSATDAAGNSVSNSFTVSVIDNTPPTITGLSDILTNIGNASLSCEQIVTWTDPTIFDNVGVLSTAWSHQSGSGFGKGEHLVTVIATDAADNKTTNTFKITVVDDTLPQIVCPADIVTAVDPGQTYATVTFSVDSSDQCGSTSVFTSVPSGSQFQLGTNRVYCTAVDESNNTNTCSFTVAVIGLPLIVTQPVGLVAASGSNVTFTVQAQSPAPIEYQWFKDGNLIQGAEGSSLSLTNVQDSDAGSYSVEVSNLAGSVASVPAMLQIAHLPFIVFQPIDRTNAALTTATFSVAIDTNATSPTAYQWLFNGTNVLIDSTIIYGSTSSTLVLSNVLAANSGYYSVLCSNAAGVILSSNALLTVLDPHIVTQPQSLSVVLGTSVSIGVAAAGTPILRYQWQQNGVDIQNATNQTLHIASVRDSDGGEYRVLVSNGLGYTLSAPATLTVLRPPVFVSGPSSLTLNAGESALFEVSVNGTLPFSYQWQKDGTNIPGANLKRFTISSVVASDAGGYRVIVSNSDGTNQSSVATLTIVTAPVITGQPNNVTKPALDYAVLSVTNTGSSSVYRWYKNATNLLSDSAKFTGTSTSVLTVSNLIELDGGTYTVTISNRAGSVTSQGALITVIDPYFVTLPQGSTLNPGGTLMLSASVVGTEPMTYQWSKDASLIPGATNSTYSVPAVSLADAGTYVLSVRNANNTSTSSPSAVVVVNQPVEITAQPQSTVVASGRSVEFSVTTVGTSPISYQWYFNGTPIPGAQSSSLVISNAVQSDGGNYKVAVTNIAGFALSQTALLTVVDPPVITSQPQSVTNAVGSSVSFVVTNGGSECTYAWYFNSTNQLTEGLNTLGVSTPILVLSNINGLESGNYTVVLSNLAGVVTSTPAYLQVADPMITFHPSSITNVVGSTATFSVAAVGSGQLRYQWQWEGLDLYGETNSTLVLPDIADSDAGLYTVIVWNEVGSDISIPAVLQTFPPLIKDQPVSRTVMAGEQVSFSVGVDGQTPFSYQWYCNGNPIPEATNRLYIINSASAANIGGYFVIVTNPLGFQQSETAQLNVSNSLLLNLAASGNGDLNLSVIYYAGQSVKIQISEDLENWTDLQTVVTPAIIKVDKVIPALFFRGVVLP